METQEPKSLIVKLPDGRKFDVVTNIGAIAFLETGPESQDLLACYVAKMSSICSKTRLDKKDRKALEYMNKIFAYVAYRVERAIFRKLVRENVVKAWVDYAIEQFIGFRTSHSWIATGNLPPHHIWILYTCCYMMHHALPVAIALEESDFFNAMADFVKARKEKDGRALPSDWICHLITLAVSRAYNASRYAFDNKRSVKGVLKQLEVTGVLAQFIRCVTVPRPRDYCDVTLFRMLDDLQECVPFIRSKLKQGQPFGEIIIAILEGRDGSRDKRPKVLNKLKTIKRFADKWCNWSLSCYSCELNLLTTFQTCCRCQNVHYCSKDCQRAHWKIHKKECVPITKERARWNDRWELFRRVLLDFANRDYIHIMVKMAKACEQTGLSKNDMLVEVNFRTNENGIVPAMQDVPEFKIAPIADYIDGSRPAEPDWFGKNNNKEKYEEKMKWYLRAIRERHSGMLPDSFLFLYNCEAGQNCYEVTWKMHNQEAVVALQNYMNTGDIGPLSKLLIPADLQRLKKGLYDHYGYEEATLDE